MPNIIVIFTSKQVSDVLEIGGTAWWKLNAVKARSASHVLLVHNANDPRRPGNPDRHGQSFLLGTIRDLKQDEDGRWLVQFDEYAETSGSFKWPGYRNPVTYMNDEEVLGQLKLTSEWERMPDVPFEDAQRTRRADDASSARMEARRHSASNAGQSVRSFAEIVEFHKQQLSIDLGVEASKISISIAT